MHATQHRNRSTIIDRLDDLRRKFQPEVRLPLSYLNRVFAGRPPIDIMDIGESLSAQQLLREALRGKADGPGNLYNPHSGCFEGPSAAATRGSYKRPAAPASERLVRKRRRVCVVCIGVSPLSKPS